MYGFSICMSCIYLDLHEKDDGKWEVDCKKGNKLLPTTLDEQSCPDYEKHKNTLPWWYADIE